MTNFRFTDPMFRGVYRGTQKHEGNDIMRLMVFIITGGNLEDSHRLQFFSTVGCHPTRCAEFDPQGAGQYLKVIAVGEYFERQFDLEEEARLPMFLSCRNAHADFLGESRLEERVGCQVHSFDGSQRDAAALLDLDLYIRINVCVCVCVCVFRRSDSGCVFDIRQVLEVMAGVRDEGPLDLAETIYNNTTRLFFKHTS
uniref:TatD DNase domain containing 1 n=1 Tax=Sinocyclocheilus rhinocerous TaxID=307959 RepID=A0A673GSW8_9TELE